MAQQQDVFALDSSVEILDVCAVNVDTEDYAEQQNLDQFNYQDQLTMPRPCYYTLRLLGAWQPHGCHWLFDVYALVVCVILVATMFWILGKYD